MQDQIKISYNNVKVEITDSCPFWDYKVFKDGLEPGKKIGTGYCMHPLKRKSGRRLRCAYGLTEIHVPERCPLKKSPLVTKVEVIEGEKIKIK